MSEKTLGEKVDAAIARGCQVRVQITEPPRRCRRDCGRAILFTNRTGVCTSCRKAKAP